MQLEPGNFRYRGWRESQDLVEIIHSAVTDLHAIFTQNHANDSHFEAISEQLRILTEERVSQISHLLVQAQHRLMRDPNLL